MPPSVSITPAMNITQWHCHMIQRNVQLLTSPMEVLHTTLISSLSEMFPWAVQCLHWEITTHHWSIHPYHQIPGGFDEFTLFKHLAYEHLRQYVQVLTWIQFGKSPRRFTTFAKHFCHNTLYKIHCHLSSIITNRFTKSSAYANTFRHHG